MKVVKIVLVVLIILAVGGASFYFGMKYGNGLFKKSTQIESPKLPEGSMAEPAKEGGGLVTGELVALGDNNFDLKLNDGTIKKIIVTDKTRIRTLSEVLFNELKIGKVLRVIGEINPDGNLSALGVQVLSPATPLQRGSSPSPMPAYSNNQPRTASGTPSGTTSGTAQ
jgi:hypothetical protein